MNRTCPQKLPVGALVSTLSSRNTHIRDFESQLASKNLDLDGSATELESAKRRLRFFEEAVRLTEIMLKVEDLSFMRERVLVLLSA